MKSKRLVSFAITFACLIVSALAVANTDIGHVIRVAKFTKLFASQNRDREIQQARTETNVPVEITEIKVREKAVHLKEKFIEDNDWIKKTAFKLKNKYTKTITFVNINIDFPETETSGIMMQRQLNLGRHPVDGRPTDPLPLNLTPGESLEVLLAPEFDDIKRMIERRHAPIDVISKILFRIQDIGFDDGTVYAAGAFYKRNPDPNSPRKWIQIE